MGACPNGYAWDGTAVRAQDPCRSHAWVSKQGYGLPTDPFTDATGLVASMVPYGGREVWP